LDRFFFGINLPFTGWQSSTGFDHSGRLIASAPAGAWIYVRPNQYETKRANIVIYNWGLADSVSVDDSSVLSSGDIYSLLDPEDFFGPPLASGVYRGGMLLVPMKSTRKAVPNGVAPPPLALPAFGVFILAGSSPGRRIR
jgi:hypothetical protein